MVNFLVMKAGYVLVLIPWLISLSAPGEPTYAVRWNSRPVFRIGLWTDDAGQVHTLGTWCEQMLSNALHRNGFGGLALEGGIRYQSAYQALAAGTFDLLEVDAAAFLLYQESAANSGGAVPSYLPVLQSWQDDAAHEEPVLVTSPELAETAPTAWQSVRIGLVDSVTSFGGLAQLEWLLAQGTDFRNDIRFVVCGSPADALKRVCAGLVDAAAVPESALPAEGLEPDLVLIRTNAALVPRLFVARSDLTTQWQALLYDVVETFRVELGIAQTIPTKPEYYAAERERWVRLSRRLFGPQRATLSGRN